MMEMDFAVSLKTTKMLAIRHGVSILVFYFLYREVVQTLLLSRDPKRHRPFARDPYYQTLYKLRVEGAKFVKPFSNQNYLN